MICLGTEQDEDASLNEVEPFEGGFDYVPKIAPFKKK
jgi:hypothetical protein